VEGARVSRARGGGTPPLSFREGNVVNLAGGEKFHFAQSWLPKYREAGAATLDADRCWLRPTTTELEPASPMRSHPLRTAPPIATSDANAVQIRPGRPGWAALLITISLAVAVLGASSANAGHETVAAAGYEAGTIVIHTHERRLYYYVGSGKALRYPVGVGRAGKQWSGTAYIDGKYLSPAWKPPADIRRDKPNLPEVIPGGSTENPMGVAAMTLSGGEYAIHGTNRPSSVGGFVSYGCIRMYNEDITDLYGRVDYHTPVVVTD
jgi:lipoprotein-anchoring transpeptidase ErfK/SrfK